MSDSLHLDQDRGRKMSSSADLSSPPKSPSPFEESIVVSSGPSIPASTTTNTLLAVKPEPSAKPKRIRKPKIAADGTEITPKPRKSRAKKKDPEPADTTSTVVPTTSSKAPTAIQTPVHTAPKPTKQPRINDVMKSSTSSLSVQQNSTPEPNDKLDVRIGTTSEAIPRSSSIKSEPPTNIQPPSTQAFQPQPVSQNIQPVISSRGQNYDPIRSSTITAPRSVPTTNPSTPVQASPTKPAARASTSPSIASLINPPSVSSGLSISRPTSSLSPVQPLPAQLVQSSTVSPVLHATAPVPMPLVKSPTPPTEQSDAMDIDPKPLDISRKTSISNGSATSPNPAKAKDKPAVITPKLPPLPGQGFATSKASGARAIVIHVPLKGERNKYVNFQQLAVEKYGFNAVHPKLALQKDHLARVAANAAALERKPGAITSNDEMSLDGSDNEAEMSSGSKRKPTAENDEPAKKKRLTKEDMYDKDDPFVDDSEMAWDEQAAAVKDGFFVYSGLLVPPGGDAKVEKADGSTAAKKRSRPSKGGGAARSSSAKITKDKPDEKEKDKKEDEKKDPKTTINSGSKDGTEVKRPKPSAPRKRPTKAEADARRAERERIAKEKAAAAAVAEGSTVGETIAKPGTIPTIPAETTSALTSNVPSASTTPKQAPAVPSTA